MENNLTATMNNHILYGGFDQWHTMYKTKLVIPSTQTDNLPQHNCFCVNVLYVLNRTVWYIINCAQNWNLIIYFTHDLQNILNYSVVFDMFTKYFVYVTQQLTLASVNYNKWHNFFI